MKIKKSIFTKLMGSFLLFAVIAVASLLICLLLEMVVIGDGNIENILPFNIVDENGNPQYVEVIAKLGGWVEELDAEYNVLHVYGEKKTPQNSYTMEELLTFTSILNDDAYIGFLVRPANSDRIFLCVYNREVMRVNLNIIAENMDAENSRLSLFIPLFFVLLTLDIVLISLYLKHKIKKPLDELVNGMEGLKSGNDNIRLHIKTEAEFEKIVDTFNVMAEQLEQEKAEKNELIRKKNQMLLELSHDIKTPIATIKSCANALEAGLVPEDKLKSYYHTIDIKADRVQALSEDMFMMLKMDNVDYELHQEAVNLCEYLRQLCVEYYDEITDAGFDFRIDIPEETLTAQIDKPLFARIIGNLLSNAKKYNQSGSKVGISLVKANDKLIINVCDDGSAIDKSLADRMFTAFFRGDAARKSDGGTGLGLAISRLIAEKHGAELFYVRENELNCFRIVL